VTWFATDPNSCIGASRAAPVHFDDKDGPADQGDAAPGDHATRQPSKDPLREDGNPWRRGFACCVQERGLGEREGPLSDSQSLFE